MQFDTLRNTQLKNRTIFSNIWKVDTHLLTFLVCSFGDFWDSAQMSWLGWQNVISVRF